MTREVVSAETLARLASSPVDAQINWSDFRALFPISLEWIDMSAMFITSHPAPVAAAIECYRQQLDANPNVYLQDNNRKLIERALTEAALYLGGIDAEDIALTDSTTMGVALVYNGLRLDSGHEVLTTNQDYYVTHESLRSAISRSDASVRRISLYEEEEIDRITPDELAHKILKEIGAKTRALALTWVHSSTGVKLPLRQISESLIEINNGRDPEDHVLLCVDGVHGIGTQPDSFDDLGCDFLMAGCHKWLFGPRGTGIVAATKKGWDAVSPTIPSFFDFGAYGRWIRNETAGPTTAAAFMPGGFKAFEHLWALPEAFKLHARLGKHRVAARTSELAGQLKEGLSDIAGVTLRTPMSDELSAGIVSLDVDGQRPGQTVELLRTRNIVASVAPYATPHVRLTPSVRNTSAEIEKVLMAVYEIAR